MTDETTEDRWRHLRARNAQKEQFLQAQGLAVPTDAVVRQTWLEHILRAVGGDDAVMACRLDTQERIAGMLDNAETQMNRAKLLSGVQANGHG